MANTNRFKINGLRLELGESEAMLPMLAAKKLGISQGDILSLRILRRSLDARKKNDIFVSYKRRWTGLAPLCCFGADGARCLRSMRRKSSEGLNS